EDSEFIVRLLNSGINRKNLRFNALQFHLWHNENTRASLKQNKVIFNNAINNNTKRCDNGINQYL
ncbi:family 2 glycosyl transferase, partial [Candidatus Woesearchaeota archaeon]|nr:family 2 glycosyl transferase [Candidatus Woesearchaeota archaeon]